MDRTRVLIVDDEPEILENLDRLLSGEGYECTVLNDPLRFRALRAEVQPEIVITDLRMPGADGMTLLAAARADDPALPVILITGHASISSAVEAMQEGAFDYLTKPFTADQLQVAVERAVRHRRLLTENRELRDQLQKDTRESKVIGESPAFVRILDQVRRVAPTEANVLITGESGTGKEVIAGLIHEQSRRAGKPFVPVDCAALPEGLLESELFGHQRGAFTGAVAQRRGLLVEANGGTVFLDEIGELGIALQAKLLRALEQRQIRQLGDSRLIDLDVRVLAATNVDLQTAVKEGKFREDLYFRLNVVNLRIPALRNRREDLPILASRFLEEAAAAARRQVPRIAADAWRVLERYSWPGNVRELRNIMQRLIALDDDGNITASDLPLEMRFEDTVPAASGNGHGLPADLPLQYEEAKEGAYRAFLAAYIEQLLSTHEGNVSQAAKTAGVSRRTLHRWIAELEQWSHNGFPSHF